MSKSVLSVRGLTAHIGRRPVLSRIDLDLRRGELLVLVGPNGAGKSTLLALLAGDRSPSSGEIRLGGAPLSAQRTEDVARRRSVLTQSNEITFPFRVEEIVRMGRAPWRRRPEASRDDATVALAMRAGEVEPFAARPVTELSGGERARVAFARSRAQDCAIALLDEPTASLDIRHQHRILGEIRRHTQEGGSAIVVLHDLSLAAAYADRVALLADGKLIAVGSPYEVLDPTLLTRVYRHPIAVTTGPDGELIVVARHRPDSAPTPPHLQESSP